MKKILNKMTFSVTLDPYLVADVKDELLREETFSGLINNLLVKWLEEKKKS